MNVTAVAIFAAVYLGMIIGGLPVTAATLAITAAWLALRA
jgi:hypothetical protein